MPNNSKEMPPEEALSKMMVLNKNLHDQIESLEGDKKRLQRVNSSFRERADKCEQYYLAIEDNIKSLKSIIKKMRI